MSNPSDAVDQHYTVADAARLMACHPRTVRNWVRSGRLAPAILISARDWRIPARAMQEFLRARECRYGAAAL